MAAASSVISARLTMTLTPNFPPSLTLTPLHTLYTCDGGWGTQDQAVGPKALCVANLSSLPHTSIPTLPHPHTSPYPSYLRGRLEHAGLGRAT